MTAAQLKLLPEGTVRCVQNRAHTVRSVYARLDRLGEEPEPAGVPGDQTPPQMGPAGAGPATGSLGPAACRSASA
ncbi:hypothetical protein ACIQOF_38820 [Streptomyces sp. NPDC091265]|uniref:hypothetical protein n=1 Tax=unclassified Streptomyces TaxID=2593676 RepID=UPI00344C038C